MTTLISKKVINHRQEALLAVALSCAKYTMDNLNYENGVNDKMYLISKKIHDHFIKGNRYLQKDAKKINEILTNDYNPILMLGHNPSSLLIIILNYLLCEVECKTTLQIFKAHNVTLIKKLMLSLEYHYNKHYRYAINIMLCINKEITTDELIQRRDGEEPRIKLNKTPIQFIMEEDTFTIEWVNKSLIQLFSLEYELNIDFTEYLGNKVDTITFNINLLEDFKTFILSNFEQDVDNKELVYLKEKLE